MASANDKVSPWLCNNCGHGKDNRPERVCNCNCHEAYDAGFSAACSQPVAPGPEPEWVKQEDVNGCVVASIAMIAGKSYAEVKAELRPKDLSTEAFTSFDAESYLYEHGYTLLKKWKHICFSETDRDNWPVQPFAPVHYVQVVNGPSGKAHAVVLLANGNVLDPWAGSKPTKLSDYYQVNEIIGVFRAAPPQMSTPRPTPHELAKAIFKVAFVRNAKERNFPTTERDIESGWAADGWERRQHLLWAKDALEAMKDLGVQARAASTPRCPKCGEGMEPTFLRTSIDSKSAIKVRCRGNELSQHEFLIWSFVELRQFFQPVSQPSPAQGEK